MNVHNIDWRRRTQALSLALLSVLIATPLAFGAHVLLPHANLSLVFLIAVLVTAGRAGMEAAIYASLLSFLSYNFFFTKPFYSLAVHDDGEVATLLFFLLVAILTGKLAARMQGEMARNRDMVQQLTNINGFTRQMAAAPDTIAVQRALARHTAETFRTSAWVVLFDQEAPPQIEAYPIDARTAAPAQTLLRRWREEEEEDGAVEGYYRLTLHISEGRDGLLLLGRQALPQEGVELARMLCDLAGVTLERAMLVAELEQTRLISESEQLRSALLSSVSHDLRTPLASIIGSTSSLIEYAGSINEAGRRELLQTVLDEAQRLNRYIQNLLDMTRLGGGTLTPRRDWVDLNDIIGSALERLHRELEPLQLAIKVEESLPLLYVQGVLFEQALVNVLDNAARFSPPAGKITLRAGYDDEWITITVCDQGPGIAPELRERVFDMFFTVHDGDRNRQGTGLGLAICRGMVRAHGGEVSVVDGDEGKGACIRLTLPRHHAEYHDDAA